MAVALRLKRCGRPHRPFYRLEAIEKRNARGGRSLEVIGLYDPMVEDEQKKVKLKVDRIQYWLGQGARPSETVTSFLRKVDVKYGKKKSSRRSEQRDKKRAAAGAKKKG
jgi:small subunit ribosomal protein S16